MAYHFDNRDQALVIDGFEKGVADSPFAGISDIRNVNLISVPGEASVNFSTSLISAGVITTGTVTSVNSGTDTITFSGATNLESGIAVVFAGTVPTGISAGTVYWVKVLTSTTLQVYATIGLTDANPVDITNTTTGATFTVFAMAQPRYFTYDKDAGKYYMVDSSGQVWSNVYTTVTNSYWVYTGNNLGLGTPAGRDGNGIGWYSATGTLTTPAANTTSYILVFRRARIDYLLITNGIPQGWVYDWNPSTGGINQAGASLKSPYKFNNSHETMTAPDSTFYFCDGSWVGTWFTKANKTFNPTDTTTYTFTYFNLLPGVDTAQCLAFLGSQMLIGGKQNIIYAWDRSSALPSLFIQVAESNIQKMVTVNTNTYALVGNRGRVYYTNGSQAQLLKKIPDHISGTVEPYFQWGGLTSTKNQIYFSALATTNAGGAISQYGGVWAIDVDTTALRLTNKLSYGTYGGFASALIPNFGTNPAGTGLFIGWDSGVGRTVTDAVLNGTTTVTSASANFTSADVGRTVTTSDTTGAGTLAPSSYIVSVSNSTTVILNLASPISATGQTLIIGVYGTDATSSTPYTGSQATIDSDLIPIGTYQDPRDFTKVEYRLTTPMVSGESITIKTRLIFNTSDTGYTTTLTDSTVGNYSNIGDINFKNAQWVQFQMVLNSTVSSPSYVRLKEMRVLGLTGPTMATSQQLGL